MATSPSDVFPAPISPDEGPAAAPQPPQFLIRAVRQQDLPNITEVLARSFHAPDGAMGWMYPLLRLGIYEDLRNRISAKAPHQVFLVAVPYAALMAEQRFAHAGSAAGTAPIAGTIELGQRTSPFWEAQRTRYLYISNLAVRADFRRQGVARQLLAACDRVAAEWGIPDLCLHVLESNHAARQLYYQAGYRLRRVDTGISAWLLGQPRQMFLHKRVGDRLP